MDVVEVLERSAAASQGLMTARQLRDAGISSWELTRAVRAGRVVRVRRAVYAARALPIWPRWVVTEDGPAAAYVLHVVMDDHEGVLAQITAALAPSSTQYEPAAALAA